MAGQKLPEDHRPAPQTMFISIQELGVRKLEFSEEIRPGVIDFGSDLVQTGALKTSGRAELVAEHRGGKEGWKI